MDFSFTEEEKMFKDTVERMVKKDVEPILKKYPDSEPLPAEVCRKFLKMFIPLGVVGARIPESEGGSGLSLIQLGIFAETCPYEADDSVFTTDVTATRIWGGGTDEIKKRILPGMLSGDKIGASATSEPDAGSDPRSIKATAVLDGDHYVLNGNKIWSSGAAIADVMMVMCNAGKDAKGRNLLTPFIVERAVSPFEAKPQALMGINQTHLSEVTLDNCRIPKANILSNMSEHGLKLLTQTWLSQRVLMGLHSLGIARRAYNEALAYAGTRRQFGKAIAGFQLVQDMLVEMAMSLEGSELLCFRALDMIQKGANCPRESSMAKLSACQTSLKVCNLAIEVFGAAGIGKDVPVEKYYRDARVITFADGTMEIQKLIVGREITGISAVRS